MDQASQVSVPGLVSADPSPVFTRNEAGQAANGAGEAPQGSPFGGAESVPGATPDPNQPRIASDSVVPVAEPFEFAGQQWKSREDAEQQVSRALGRYRSAQSEAAKQQKRADDAEKVAREAANLARAWMEHAQGGQRQAVPQKEAPQAQEKPWYDALDWDFVRELAAEKGQETAMYYLAQQMDQHYTGLLDTRLKSALQPHEQRSQATQMYQETMGTFNGVAYEQDSAGQLLYPELHDQAQAEEVVRIWSTFDRSLAMTPRGVRLAVLEYRHANGIPFGGSAMPAGGNGASQGVVRGAQASARASSEVLSGSGSPRPAPAGTPGATPFKQLIGGAPATLRVGDFNLGFTPTSL